MHRHQIIFGTSWKFQSKRIAASRKVGVAHVSSIEDERRKDVSPEGRVEAICTLCEVEGKPYVRASGEYVVASTMTGEEKLITVCLDHADELDNGELPYRVVRQRKVVDWAHRL
jgi:hypothetical protein